ncbi:MAG: hypothetical protein FD155_2498, partial [Bacteroidetes bacterium]
AENNRQMMIKVEAHRQKMRGLVAE